MIIVSNGHHKFITGTAADEASRRDLLAGFITAGYPIPELRRLMTRLGMQRHAGIRRLLQRQENVPDELVHPLWLAEAVYSAARAVALRFPRFEDLADYGMQCYAWQAERVINGLSAKVYHYRSGYGRASVRRAKEKGMIALCDHSITHPQVLDFLIANEGRLPPTGYKPRLGRIWRNVLADIEQADHVLVNSDFVRDTFIHCGYDPERISVLYTGVDDRFLSLVEPRTRPKAAGRPLKLMFAGDLGRRKGGRILLQALLRIRDLPWEFVAVGSIAPDLRSEFAGLFEDSRVTVRGYLAWPELAREMGRADVFVFPSLAEGSARVVFMAMACGCHVITTRNSGSIVQDGQHGRIVEQGSVEALEIALRDILCTPEVVAAVGCRNAEQIRKNYTQRSYGEGLMTLYGKLLGQTMVHQEGE